MWTPMLLEGVEDSARGEVDREQDQGGVVVMEESRRGIKYAKAGYLRPVASGW